MGLKIVLAGTLLNRPQEFQYKERCFMVSPSPKEIGCGLLLAAPFFIMASPILLGIFLGFLVYLLWNFVWKCFGVD